MSKKMSFGKFIVTGCLGIIVALAVVHFTWVAPQIDRKVKMSALVTSAHAVQVAAAQNYLLMPNVSASTIDLQRRFPNMRSMNDLLSLVAETDFGIETGFNKETMGNALALSNYVLTGNNEPQFLTITELQNDFSERTDNLMNSVPLWPWS
jgi:hypothetical protein